MHMTGQPEFRTNPVLFRTNTILCMTNQVEFGQTQRYLGHILWYLNKLGQIGKLVNIERGEVCTGIF